jgi:hypothetical protein
MSIQGIDHSPKGRVDLAALQKPIAKNPKSNLPAQQGGIAPQTTESIPTADAGHAQGVLRLLEEGHFKGVADVRLRINFFDELHAGAVQTSNRNTQQGAEELLNTVNTQIDDLLSSLTLDEQTTAAITDLRTGFEKQVNDALSAYVGSDPSDQEALAEAIQSGFDTFIEQLRAALAPPAPAEPADSIPTDTVADGTEPPADITESPSNASNADETVSDPSVPTETPPDPVVATTEEPTAETPAVEDPLAGLIAAFNESLLSLLDSTNVSTLLPDPSPPNGNGVAYDKFLAIYNQLRGITPDENVPVSETIDEVA